MERVYHRNGFEGVYAFPLMRKPGALLENVGRENWIAFPGYNAGLVVILPEKEGWEYWKELDGRITTKPG
jgi:hypothetical protein